MAGGLRLVLDVCFPAQPTTGKPPELFADRHGMTAGRTRATHLLMPPPSLLTIP